MLGYEGLDLEGRGRAKFPTGTEVPDQSGIVKRLAAEGSLRHPGLAEEEVYLGQHD